ncbi:MAG: DUF308 domain-containing protein [Rikenellaceae bacterium]
MKQKHNSNTPIFSGIIALVLGLLITFNPSQFLLFTIMAVGIGMFIFGAVEIISAIVKNQKEKTPYGFSFFAAIIVAVLGVLIFFRPEALVSFFMYLLGIGVVFLGIGQIISLSRLRKLGARFSPLFFVFSVLLSIAGVVMLFFPLETSAWIVVFAGIWITLYGVSELFGKIVIKIPQVVAKEEVIIEAEVVSDDKK